MTNKKQSGMGTGLAVGAVVGAAAGAAAALLLAPKSGEETRHDLEKKAKQIREWLEDQELDEKVKEVFGDVTHEAREIYGHAREGVIQRLADLKEAVEDIDYDKYKEAVADVVRIARERVVDGADRAERLRGALMREWKKIERERAKAGK